jgi:hypothetical protein
MTRPVSLGSEAGWGGGAPRAAARGKASTRSPRCPGGTRFLSRQTSGTTGGPGTCGASGGRRPADRDTEADPGGGPAGAASRLSRSRVAPPSPRRVYAERLGGGGAVCVRRAGRASHQFTWAKGAETRVNVATGSGGAARRRPPPLAGRQSAGLVLSVVRDSCETQCRPRIATAPRTASLCRTVPRKGPRHGKRAAGVSPLPLDATSRAGTWAWHRQQRQSRADAAARGRALDGPGRRGARVSRRGASLL